jgi:hypothetical protein
MSAGENSLLPGVGGVDAKLAVELIPRDGEDVDFD